MGSEGHDEGIKGANLGGWVEKGRDVGMKY